MPTRHIRSRKPFAVLALLLAPIGPIGAPARAREPVERPMLDCNGNGVEDARDIALGTSADEDFDGVPDECESAARIP